MKGLSGSGRMVRFGLFGPRPPPSPGSMGRRTLWVNGLNGTVGSTGVLDSTGKLDLTGVLNLTGSTQRAQLDGLDSTQRACSTQPDDRLATSPPWHVQASGHAPLLIPSPPRHHGGGGRPGLQQHLLRVMEPRGVLPLSSLDGRRHGVACPMRTGSHAAWTGWLYPLLHHADELSEDTP